MNQLHYFPYEKISYTQKIQEDYANRTQIPVPNYKVRDYVFVNARNLNFEWLFQVL